MSMNEKLAEFYGTNQPSEADLEKLAAAELAESLQESGDVSLEDLDAEQLEALAREVLSDDESGDESGEDSGEEYGGEEGDVEKVAEAEFEQADFMGRVMAHALHNEMQAIANAEAEKTAGVKDWANKAKDGAKKAWDATKEYHARGARYTKGGVTGKTPVGEVKGKDRAKALGKGLAHFAPHAAVAGGAGYAAKKKMEKKASGTPAFDALVEARIAQYQEQASAEQGDEGRYETLEAAVDAAARNALGIE